MDSFDFNTTGYMEYLVPISTILGLLKEMKSDQIWPHKKSDQISEMPGLSEFCDYCFKNYSGRLMTDCCK